MDGFNDQMFRIGDELFLAAGIGTPEDEDDRVVFFIQFLDDRIGEDLPALSLMGIGPMFLYSQNSIEQ